MTPPYGFGLSQEDERTEATGLAVPAGRVLSVSSAGDMPLSLLASGAERVVAVDIDLSQVHLGELKLAAVTHLSRRNAIQFLGFLPARSPQRALWFDALEPHLRRSAVEFWRIHRAAVLRGPILAGRYERFVHKLRAFVWPLAGRNFRALTSCSDVDDQRRIFARAFDRPLLKALFLAGFQPRVYAGRGLDSQALRHHAPRDSLGLRFFRGFQAACTGSPACDNYLLQMHLLGRVSGFDVVPEYLTAKGFQVVRERASAVSFVHASIQDYLRSSAAGSFDRFHLSNLSDWLSVSDFHDLLSIIEQKAATPARIIWRNLHRSNGPPTGSAIEMIPRLGTMLAARDRFPIYGVEVAQVS